MEALTILVTGAAGFIASRVAHQLVRDGRRVVGLDNMNNAYDTRLKEYRLTTLTPEPLFTFVRADICDADALSAAWEKYGPFEAVINLAARAGVRFSMIDPWVYVNTNIIGTLNLLHLCRRSATRKFVLASTSSLYGASTALPYVETGDTERPLSPYAASKKGAEALCHSYYHLYGIDVTILRYFTVYGPAGRPDMSPFRFVQWIAEGKPVTIYGDGSQSRDFTYVDDIARGTCAALRPVGFEIINLGGDRPATIASLVQLVEKKVGLKAVLTHLAAHPTDVPATWADIKKAKDLLQWTPAVNLDEGIGRTVEWYLENRDWAAAVDTA